MDELQKQIKEMYEKLKPEAFAIAIEKMKSKADKGLLDEVTSADIEKIVITTIDGVEPDEDELNNLMEEINTLDLEITNAINLYESFDIPEEEPYNILEDSEKQMDTLDLLKSIPLNEEIYRNNYLKKLFEVIENE